MRITPTELEKKEWSRLAQAAYYANMNDIGHCFSGLAALRKGESLHVQTYDAIMTQYRDWLNFGFWPNVNTIVRL